MNFPKKISAYPCHKCGDLNIDEDSARACCDIDSIDAYEEQP